MWTESNVRKTEFGTETKLTAETGSVNFAMAPKEKSSKDWLSHQVQDTVKDGLRIRRNDVATLGKSPGNWVEEPKKDGPDSASHICP